MVTVNLLRIFISKELISFMVRVNLVRQLTYKKQEILISTDSKQNPRDSNGDGQQEPCIIYDMMQMLSPFPFVLYAHWRFTDTFVSLSHHILCMFSSLQVLRQLCQMTRSLLFFISIYTANCLKAWDTFFASQNKHKPWINYEAMQLFSCFLMLSDYSRTNAIFLNITPSNNNGDGDNLFTCKISGSRSIDLTLKPYLLLKCSS